jgi:aspartyl/asparaginyl beta-hydroxylase (cupin superfamily)
LESCVHLFESQADLTVFVGNCDWFLCVVCG